MKKILPDALANNDFVRKPFQEEEIFEKIAQYVGVRYVYQQEVGRIAEQNASLIPSGFSAHLLASLGERERALPVDTTIPPAKVALTQG